MRKLSKSWVLVLVILAVGAVLAEAQTTTSVLQGTVYDPSGAVMAGATVEVKGPTVTRTVTADATGFYRAAALPAGTYTVTASQAGFKTKVLENIVLVLDRTATLNIHMEVAPRTETEVVSAEVPLIDTTNPSMKNVINAHTIDSIPLNGRNYLDLIQLSPGVVVNSAARTDLTNRDSKGSILGTRAGNILYLIDGQENTDDFHGGVLQAFTQDSVQEFEVISAGYKAEFGRGSGGVVNVITKSGTNDYHGNAFLYVRNDGMDSSNVANQPPPKLERYDYGATVGGPIRRDKAWFFGSLENVKETRGNIYPPNIPDALAAMEDFSRQPESKDLRALGKYDQRINDKNTLSASLSWTRSRRLNELASAIALPSASNNNETKTWLGTVSLTSMLSPTVILESAFSARVQDFAQNQNTTFGTAYSIFFLDDGSSFDFGPPLGSIQTLKQRYYTGREIASFYLGKHHSVKAGLEYIRTSVDGVNGQGLQNVIVTIHPFFDLYGVDSFQIPQGIAFLNPGDNLSRLRNNGTSFFLQDDWHATSSLMFSLGARYDYDSKFGDSNNISPRLGITWGPDSKTQVSASFGLFYDRYRLGLAQAVPELGGFNGRTVVELDFPRLTNDALVPFPGTMSFASAILGDPNFLNTQFGIPVGTLVDVNNIQALTGMTPDQFLTALNTYLGTLGIAQLPVEFSPSTGFLRQDLGAAFQDEIRMARPFKTPFNRTFTIGVEREVAPNFVIGGTYVHRDIRNILGVRITNLAYDSRFIGAAITTDGGPLKRTYGPWFDGVYDAWILSVNKRFANHFQLQASYTYAQGTDNLLNSNLGIGIGTQGGGAVPTDNLDLEFDRGNSDLLVPHSFVFSGLWDLPYGFQWSGVVHATSGVYFTAAGTPTDYDGDGIVSTRPPNTRRNQFRGPASFNVDMRVAKKFTFAERYSLSGLIEFFNLTNRANPELIDNFFVGGQPGPTFGTVRVPFPGREIQVGVRFDF